MKLPPIFTVVFYNGEARWRAPTWSRRVRKRKEWICGATCSSTHTAKFGDVPAWVHERATAATKTKLETWAKRLLVAEKPEDVFEE